jgi:hypothetical protein
MQNITFKTIFLAAIFLNISAINPSDLIKVTHENEQSCVEYYNYQGEMYCSTKALAPQAVDPAIKSYETQHIVFDHRPWEAAWGKKTDDIQIVEYVPMGENINHWHELVTSQFFQGIQDKVTPKEFADGFINRLKNLGFNPTITFISETPTTVIFEFQIGSPQSQIQDELQKITKGKDGIYVLHYVIKKQDMGPEARKLWVRNLSGSTIKS